MRSSSNSSGSSRVGRWVGEVWGRDSELEGLKGEVCGEWIVIELFGEENVEGIFKKI